MIRDDELAEYELLYMRNWMQGECGQPRHVFIGEDDRARGQAGGQQASACVDRFWWPSQN